MEEILDFGNSIFHGVNGEFIAFDVDNSTSPSPLIILRQNSLSIEQVYKNGLSKKVHVVVKNHPFLLQVGLSSTMWDGHKIDFTRFPLDAKLVYDTEQLKEVNFVKMKPLEFKCHVNERGDQVTVELRPKVLTSQLEDMLFRVRIQALDSSTKQPIQGLVAYSESIKVVSKPEQVKKKKKASSQPKPKPVQKSKEDTKKEVTDLVSDHLSKIESSCDVHQNLLAMLSDTLTPSLNLPLLEKVEVPAQKLQIKEEKHTHPFEKAFLEFLAAYDNLEQFEKPSKIRKVMKNSSTRETETVTEMLEAFGQTSSMPFERDQKQMDNNKNPHSRTCECAYCPHREELKRIDDFYNRFLITADSIM